MNKVVTDLKKFGTVQRAVLGISGTDVTNYIDQQKEKGKEIDLGTITGIYISEVSDGSAAEEGGLQKGDIIIALDGKNIEKFSEMQEVMVNHNPGDKMVVTYLRDKKKEKVTVTLRNIQGTTSVVENIDTETMGAALRPLTEKEKKELNLSYGLVVSAVKEGKMKEQGITKGIIIMKVNDKDMRSLADFEEVVKEANMSSDRVLWIRAKTQSGINRSFIIELDPQKSKR
jgi:S1-C subfamily serine protease